MVKKALKIVTAMFCVFLVAGCSAKLNILGSPSNSDTEPENTELPTTGTVAKRIELKTTISRDLEEDVRSSIQASNGKIYSVGFFKSEPAMWAANSDGTLDTSFGKNGFLNLTVDNESYRGRTFIAVVGSRLLVTSSIGRYFEETEESVYYVRVDAFNFSGDVDTTFATNGVFEIEKTDYIYSDGITADSQGRLYLPYYSRETNPARAYVMRLSSSGALDVSFASAGIKTLPVLDSSVDNFVRGITFDESDNVILHGTYGALKSMLWKIDTSGNAINSFGSSGIVDLGTMPEIAGLRYANSKLWIAHHNGTTGHYRGVSAISRLNSNGSMDTTFNGTGKLVLATLGGTAYTNINTQNVDIVGLGPIESDGSVLVVAEGATYACFGCEIIERTFYALRVTNSGTVDTTYGVSGYASKTLFLTEQRGQLILKQSDGSYILPMTLGRTENSTQLNMAFWKLNSSGTDTSFGSGGVNEWSQTTTSEEYDYTEMITDEAGAIYVVSAFERGRLDPITYVKKYNYDGNLITSFGTNGLLELGNRNIQGMSLLNGSLYLLDDSFKLISYTLNGQLRTTWGNSGEVQAFPGYTIDSFMFVSMMSHQGGIILATSHVENYSREGIIMQRLSSTGAPDVSWGTDGIRYTVTTDKSLIEEKTFPVLDDGSFFLVYEEYEGTLDILKFNASGVLDTNFASSGAIQLPQKTDSWNSIGGLVVKNNKLYLNVAKQAVDHSWSGNCFSRYSLDGIKDTSIPGGEWCTDTHGIAGETSNVITFRIVDDDSVQILYEWWNENNSTEGKAFKRYTLSTGDLEFSKDFALEEDAEAEISGYFINNSTYLSFQQRADELETIVLYK